MKRIIIVALALAVGGSAQSLLAQAPGRTAPPTQPPAAGPGEIRGSVADAATQDALSTASVSVWSTADSTLVAGAVVRPDGTFRIQGLRPGSYYLRVGAMGFAPASTAPLTLSSAAPRADAGAVRLTRAAVAIEGLEVRAERSAVSIAPDRNTYSARDVAPAGGTASDVLRGVPSVEVDPDGKISLRGNENVVVQINGRPTPIRGAQLAGYLQQLPSTLVDRVEVVPNPSAKYDPEGMAGIVNIVLKANADLGVSGGLTLGAASTDRYSGSGNIGYQAGPLTLFATYGLNHDQRDVTGINERERRGAGIALPFINQAIASDNERRGHNLNTSIDYRLGEKNVLSTGLLLNSRRASEEMLNAYSELTPLRVLEHRYDRIRDAGEEGSLLDYNVAFKRTMEPQRHEISAELRLTRSESRDDTELWRQPLSWSGGITGTPLDREISVQKVLNRQGNAQLDYVRKLAPRTKLESGYKGTARWLENDFRVRKDALGSGEWVESELSNGVEFDERVNALYGVVSHGIGKLELQAGLRAEYAEREFTLADSAQRFPHDYGSFFPSGLVSYALGDATQVKASYSRRIRRPGTQELNPFPVFFDLQNVFLGNPSLRPEYTDAFELGLQRSGRLGSVQLSPFYRRTTDVIRFIIDTDDVVAGREVTSVSFKNLDTSDSWGTDLNGSLRLGKRFSGFGSVNVYKMVTEGSGSESSLSSDAVTWSARLNGNVQVTPGLTLQGMYFYRAPMEIEGGRFSAMSMTNVSLRQKLFGEKAAFSVRVMDPFNTMRFRVEAGDDNLKQVTERRMDNRAVHLMLQYNFGRAPKIRQRPAPAEDGPSGFPG